MNPPAASPQRPPAAASPVFDEPARVERREPVAGDTVELTLRSPRIAQAARPGQFVNVLVPGGDFGTRVFGDEAAWRAAAPRPQPLLLRRPFSIYRVRSDAAGQPAEAIDLLVKVVGEGTRRLASLSAGSEVRTLGPLGRPCELPPPGAPAVLVAGGCGWAGLGLLARELRRRAHPTYAFIGAATVEGLPLRTTTGAQSGGFLGLLPDSCVTSAELEELGIVVGLAAEQGGRLYGGVVTDLLERFLASEHGPGAHVYACGPLAMLRRVAELAAEHAAPCQLSFEKRMACGMGVCMSCVCEVVGPDGAPGHKRLCVDGPVLHGDEVNWDEEVREA